MHPQLTLIAAQQHIADLHRAADHNRLVHTATTPAGGAVVAGNGGRPFARDRFRGGSLVPRRRSARSKAWGRPGALRRGGREQLGLSDPRDEPTSGRGPAHDCEVSGALGGGLRHEDGEASVD